MLVTEEILDSLHGLIADICDEILELGVIGWSELPRMSVDGSYEGGRCLAEVGVKLLYVLVHLWDRVHHFLWEIQINDISLSPLSLKLIEQTYNPASRRPTFQPLLPFLI